MKWCVNCHIGMYAFVCFWSQPVLLLEATDDILLFQMWATSSKLFVNLPFRLLQSSIMRQHLTIER